MQELLDCRRVSERRQSKLDMSQMAQKSSDGSYAKDEGPIIGLNIDLQEENVDKGPSIEQMSESQKLAEIKRLDADLQKKNEDLKAMEGIIKDPQSSSWLRKDLGPIVESL